MEQILDMDSNFKNTPRTIEKEGGFVNQLSGDPFTKAHEQRSKSREQAIKQAQ